jgi:hypothetical protein
MFQVDGYCNRYCLIDTSMWLDDGGATLRFMIGGHCNIPGWWPVQKCVADGHYNGFWLMDTSIAFNWRTQEWFLVDWHYIGSLFMDPKMVPGLWTLQWFRCMDPAWALQCFLVYGPSNDFWCMDTTAVPCFWTLRWFLVYGHYSGSLFMDLPMVPCLWALQWFLFYWIRQWFLAYGTSMFSGLVPITWFPGLRPQPWFFCYWPP